MLRVRAQNFLNGGDLLAKYFLAWFAEDKQSATCFFYNDPQGMAVPAGLEPATLSLGN